MHYGIGVCKFRAARPAVRLCIHLYGLFSRHLTPETKVHYIQARSQSAGLFKTFAFLTMTDNFSAISSLFSLKNRREVLLILRRPLSSPSNMLMSAVLKRGPSGFICIFSYFSDSSLSLSLSLSYIHTFPIRERTERTANRVRPA